MKSHAYRLDTCCEPPARPRSGSGQLRARLLSGVDLLFLWMERSRGRRDLGKLDDRLLHDIGVNRADVEAEYRKPFWRS